MQLGRKSQVITKSLGVKNSKPTSNVGIKQSYNPYMDSDYLVKDNTANGITNHSN